MKHIALALVVLFALPPLAAQEAPLAAQEGRDPERVLEALQRRFDDDGDGRVSRAEFPGRPFRFARLDRNRDGFLDEDDLPEDEGAAPAEGAPAFGDDALAFFETSVRPLLAEHCFRCHSSEADRIKGGLRVDSREALLAGGGSGPALVPGDADASLLVIAVRYTDEDLAMPPKVELDRDEVRALERWVDMGAPWPAATGAAPVRTGDGIDLEAGRAWWSFQAPSEPPVAEPSDADWALCEIDAFLLAEMEEHGVTPVDDADDRTWLRRVTFDLTGLPPTPEEIAAFEADRSDARFERVVDRLLASPGYGERWSRRWLDVARYAESSGKDSNVLYPHAWRYRDWVIEAFDRDLPYDRFLMEQIAGDLLPAESAEQRARHSIATGYLALGTKSHNARDRRQFELDVADEQIDALTQGMLGLTVACARCHDHKFDPIPTEDYYALSGIFQSSTTLYGTKRGQGNRYPTELVALPDGDAFPDGARMDPTLRRLIERQRDQVERRAEGEATRRFGDDAASMEPPDARQMRLARQALTVVDDLLSRFDEDGRPTSANRVAMGMRDERGRDAQVLARGELDAAGARVPRGVPQVLRDEDTPEIGRGSGRLELAQWVASDENPLTARVWVNRVWMHLFGRGIVATPNNFGASGQEPSHPELLDWLALRFVADGWSTKSLVRQIVLSHAYRLASSSDARNAVVDPDALLLWRMPERRLEAEAIRDAMLFAAGTLELAPPAGSPINTLEGQPRREQVLELVTRPTNVRSVYLPVLRDRVPEALDVFDAADPSFVTGDREETNVATQALFLMNDAEVLAAADAFGARLLAHEGKDTDRIALAFELALGREPGSAEKRAVKAFLKDYARLAEDEKAPEQKAQQEPPRRRRGQRGRSAAPAPPRDPRLAAWSAFAQALFQSAEFRYAG